MAEYQSISHAKYDIKYPIVWITKYRYKVITKEIGEQLKSLLNPRKPKSRDDNSEWSYSQRSCTPSRRISNVEVVPGMVNYFQVCRESSSPPWDAKPALKSEPPAFSEQHD